MPSTFWAKVGAGWQSVLGLVCARLLNVAVEEVNQFFNRVVQIARIRHGNRQTLDTLVSEEAILLAKFLTNEKQSWIPRLVSVQFYSTVFEDWR